jgi:hypothetical protein
MKTLTEEQIMDDAGQEVRHARSDMRSVCEELEMFVEDHIHDMQRMGIRYAYCEVCNLEVVATREGLVERARHAH